jgi:phage tail-like protein
MANRTTDPFLAFRYELSIDNFPVASFSECSGLQVEIEVHSYHEGGQNDYELKFPGRVKQSNLTLKRGIAGRELWDWYYDMALGEITRGDLRKISVKVYDPGGREEVAVWECSDAFPARWVGPELNAAQNNVAVETLELAYQRLFRKK